MIRRLLPSIVVLFALQNALVAQTPPTAKELVDRAVKSAKDTNRSAMILFHASWCGWCHRMEEVMNRPEIKPIFDKYFVVQWLVVMENSEKKALENAGGDAYLKAAGGGGSGIPFFYFADGAGRMIVNSARPANGADKGGNVGCPYEDNEIAWFMEMLRRAAPKMTAVESDKVKTAFQSLKKSKGG